MPTKSPILFLVASVLSIALIFVGPFPAKSQDYFRNGDRVTLLGGTSIERMQQFGYFETLVTSSYPDLDLKFRNIGWSGDDVSGLARAVFGKQPDGFARLKHDLELTKPTVVIINYGANESFAGEQGVQSFLDGLEKIVSLVRELNARPILLSPSRLENLGPPLPDPENQNANIQLYVRALAAFAGKHEIAFIDFYRPLGDRAVNDSATPAIRDRLTDNGRHFNAYGHWRTAMTLAERMGLSRPIWNVEVDPEKKSFEATGTLVSELKFGDSIEFSAVDDYLPICAPPDTTPRGGEMTGPHDRIQVSGLPEGHWGLQIDGKPAVLASTEEWGDGVFVNRALYINDSEKLREAIIEKNELFFYRHRPQNETYLFLFRKHEQGNNAVEIPQFDRLIEEQENRIASLKKANVHHYKFVKVAKPVAGGETEDDEDAFDSDEDAAKESR